MCSTISKIYKTLVKQAIYVYNTCMCYFVAQRPQEVARSQTAHEDRQDGVHSDQQAGKIS